MKMDQTEKLILEAIDQHRDEIIELARDIYDHGELGYKEFNTAEKFIKKMKELGLRTETGLAITGTKAYLNDEKKDTASLALLGELDALRIPEHAHANPETDAAHCCGHHAQMAGILGAALALTVPDFLQHRRKSMVKLDSKMSCVHREKYNMAVENVSCFVSAHLMILIFVLHITLHRGMTS